MSSDLNGQLRQHYLEQTLSAETLERLCAQAQLIQTPPERSTRHRHYAAAAVVLTAVTLWILFGGLAESPQEWSIRAAQEIVLNHNKQLREEVVARDYPTLQIQMSKLDFNLAAPIRLAALKLDMVGARYCSIQGHLAAQIMLRDANGRRYTLYQTPASSARTGVPDYASVVEGVSVRQWIEGGVFFGLATSNE